MENQKNKIITFEQQFSSGVMTENRANATFAADHFGFARGCQTAEQYYKEGFSAAYIEYPSFLKDFKNTKLKILDVGVGRGESSVFLASQGHKVFSVEPSFEFCQLIAFVSEKFSLNITPICTVGENMARINEKDFDLIIFNSSLHHCDDPVLALHQAHLLLKPNGKIFLCSEIQLKPWTNKKAWYERLISHPQEMGHYGGNEHAYYNWEYTSMLKRAGFSQTETLPSNLFLYPQARILIDLTTNSSFEPVADIAKQLKYFLRVFYYYSMALLCRIKPLYNILSRLSVVPGQYKATKSLYVN